MKLKKKEKKEKKELQFKKKMYFCRPEIMHIVYSQQAVVAQG